MTGHRMQPAFAPEYLSGQQDPLAITLFRHHWKWLAGLGSAGLLLGLVVGLTTPRKYVSHAMFIPQSQEQTSSTLAIAASQFGISLPSGSSAWGPGLYVELLTSRMLLEGIAKDTLVVPEEGNRPIAMMDLMRAPDLPRSQRVEATIRLLRTHVIAIHDKQLSLVRLNVSTEWPSVSWAIADRLVQAVNRFNLVSRKTQATEERKFVETRVAEAEQALRVAESDLQGFMQRNRVISGSPGLVLEQDRLQRMVNLRQSLLTTLLQKREEARIKEAGDLAVVTVIQTPEVPVVGESRRVAMKMVLGAMAGFAIALVISFMKEGLAGAGTEGGAWPGLHYFRALREALFYGRRGASAG